MNVKAIELCKTNIIKLYLLNLFSVYSLNGLVR